jgi:hypothetical protein
VSIASISFDVAYLRNQAKETIKEDVRAFTRGILSIYDNTALRNYLPGYKYTQFELLKMILILSSIAVVIEYTETMLLGMLIHQYFFG